MTSIVTKVIDRDRSLRRFVESIYLPLECSHTSAEYRSQIRRAVDDFWEHLGRAPRLIDLTPETVDEFLREHAKVQTKWLTNQTRTRLRAVWRYAHEIGMADPVPSMTRWKKPKATKVRKLRKGRMKPDLTEGSLSEFFELHYRPLRLLDAKESSIRQYRHKVADFSKWADRPVMVTELTDRLVADYLASRLAEGIAPVTVNSDRSHLLALWRFAVEDGVIDHLPRIRRIRQYLDEPDSWAEDELREMFANCESLNSGGQMISGVPAGDLVRAILLLAYWTGLRRGTIAELRWADFDLDKRSVVVPGSVMKSRRGKRFRYGEDAAEALEKIRPYGGDTVIPKINWHRFYDFFDLLLDAAKVPRSRRKSMGKLHKVRRTVATMMAVRSGVAAASNLLGHSGHEITQRYIDSSRMPGADATECLPSLT